MKEYRHEEFHGDAVSVSATLLNKCSALGMLLDMLSAPGLLKDNTLCSWASERGWRDIFYLHIGSELNWS